MFGYLSYELGLELEDMLSASTTKFSRTSQEGKKAINKDLPLGFFIVPRSFLAYDHSTKMYYTIGMEGGDNGDSNDSTTNDGRQDAERLLDMVDKIVKSNDRVSLHDSEESRSSKGMLVAWKSKDAYKADIEECLRQISNGDTYEVCLTVQFQGKQNKPALQASTQCPALSTYRRLRLFNSAPYASFIKHNFRSNSPSGFGFAICCSSPERYLKIEEVSRRVCG
ncbi:hypothetical protein EON65_17990 [archaeon]|nr:MAG: hypothetical protein EON65_17990 [archaeon]